MCFLGVRLGFIITFQHPISLNLKSLFYSNSWGTDNFIWKKPVMKAKLKRERKKKLIMLGKADTQKSVNIIKLFVEY